MGCGSWSGATFIKDFAFSFVCLDFLPVFYFSFRKPSPLSSFFPHFACTEDHNPLVLSRNIESQTSSSQLSAPSLASFSPPPLTLSGSKPQSHISITLWGWGLEG